MSGGHFEYIHHRIFDFVDDLKCVVKNNNIPYSIDSDEYGYGFDFNQETIDRLQLSQELIKDVGQLSKDIDWLCSGDIGEDDFIKSFDEFSNKHLKDDYDKPT